MRNFTIVRPSLTYSTDRLQFAISEEEEWLYRAMHGRSIVFPKDMVNVKTTMSFGGDVADAIAKLAGNSKALGETVHITGRTYQIKYARRISRTFEGRKLDSIIGETYFLTAEEGLKRCLEEFLDDPKGFKDISAKPQAYFDRLVGECTELNEFLGQKMKLKYVIARYTPLLCV